MATVKPEWGDTIEEHTGRTETKWVQFSEMVHSLNVLLKRWKSIPKSKASLYTKIETFVPDIVFIEFCVLEWGC